MNITVKRYDPSKDAAPYDVTFEVPHTGDAHMTLLQALVYIHENYGGVAFDFSCRARNCGRCSMMLDGKPVLACVEPLADGDHTVEPLAGMPVIRDLMVDKSTINGELSATMVRKRIAPLTIDDIQAYNMEDAEELAAIQYCARCHLCTTVCPVRASDPSYVGPARMLATALRHFDPYDQSDRLVEAVQNGLWSCIMCGMCTQVCNQIEIDHLAIWQKLRDDATERGYVLA